MTLAEHTAVLHPVLTQPARRHGQVPCAFLLLRRQLPLYQKGKLRLRRVVHHWHTSEQQLYGKLAVPCTRTFPVYQYIEMHARLICPLLPELEAQLLADLMFAQAEEAPEALGTLMLFSILNRLVDA